jgi:hypothetical protein
MYSMLTEAVATEQIAERRRYAAEYRRARPGRPARTALRRPRKPTTPRAVHHDGVGQPMSPAVPATCK